MLPFGQNGNGQLIRQNKAFPRVTGQQTGPYGLFGMAVVIKIGRVKIGISGRHKIVDHGIELKLIDLPVLLQGQAHGAEAQGFNCVLKKSIQNPPHYSIYFILSGIFFPSRFPYGELCDMIGYYEHISRKVIQYGICMDRPGGAGAGVSVLLVLRFQAGNGPPGQDGTFPLQLRGPLRPDPLSGPGGKGRKLV